MNRPLSLRQLRQILRGFGVAEDSSRGKGSHTVFSKVINGRTESYPVPTSSGEVLVSYMGPIRRKFKLTPADGVTDEEFYENA